MKWQGGAIGDRPACDDLPYRPGIDGLRALAVAAVVGYHADLAWLPGGFLGVDLFFAISGYLICSLLLAEWGRNGSLSLRAFWIRRARRLLPALGVVLAASAGFAVAFAPDAAWRLRADLVAAGLYVSNWWQILAGQSYFDAIGRPPLLRHLWSLAVEEQFYLVFPVLLGFGLRRTGGRRAPIAAAAVTTGIASTLLMAHLWRPDTDPSRVFFGTDTRAVGLCAGVFLACVWHPGSLSSDLPGPARRLLDAAGVLALAALGILALRLGEFDPVLYRGGFAAVAVASAVVIAVAAHPASRLGRALAWRPLVWAGTRSYAIYLWHWPVFMLTRPGLDTALTGWRNLVVRLAVTAALAEASWRLVEQPIRRGFVLPTGRPRLLAGAAIASVTVVLGALLVSAPAPRPPELLARALQLGTAAVPTSTSAPSSPTPHMAVTTSAQAPATVAPPAPNPTPPRPNPAPRRTTNRAPRAVTPTTAPLPPPPPPEGAVLAVGDSVMATARDAFHSASGGKAVIDADVGRQVDDGLDVLQRYRDAGDLARVSAVVLHLGSNGPMTERHFQRLAELVEGVPRVVVVNVRVPRRWEEQSNNSIRDGMPAHRAMRLADWYRASAEKGVLSSDGVHPTPSGAKVYARLIVELLQPEPEPEPTTTTSPPPDEPPPTTEPSTTTTERPTTTTTTTPSTTSTTTTQPPPEPPAS